MVDAYLYILGIEKERAGWTRPPIPDNPFSHSALGQSDDHAEHFPASPTSSFASYGDSIFSPSLTANSASPISQSSPPLPFDGHTIDPRSLYPAADDPSLDPPSSPHERPRDEHATIPDIIQPDTGATQHHAPSAHEARPGLRGVPCPCPYCSTGKLFFACFLDAICMLIFIRVLVDSHNRFAHLSTHDPSARRFYCGECPCHYTRSNDLKKHIKNKHPTNQQH